MDPNKDNKELQINKAQLCQYCNGRPKLTDSKKVYGENSNYGPVWLCTCGAYVGCHPGTNKPLGRVADKELRYWKHQAHEHFDKLWKRSGFLSGNRKKDYEAARVRGYAWIGEQLGTEKRFTHIGMFDIEQCKKVIELCKPYLNAARRKEAEPKNKIQRYVAEK